MIVNIDHVGIAVEDLDAAVEHYRRTLGVEPSHRERVEDQGVEEVLFAVGTSSIQLKSRADCAHIVMRSDGVPLESRGDAIIVAARRVDVLDDPAVQRRQPDLQGASLFLRLP